MKRLNIWDILNLQINERVYIYLKDNWTLVSIIQIYWDSGGGLYLDYKGFRMYCTIVIKRGVFICQ